MKKNSNILIVDDERFYINVLVDLLKDKYKLYIAKSGEQALTRIKSNQPDLILLDIMMPDMDGYQTCIKIKKNPLWTSIPIIFLTGKTDQEAEAKAFDFGAVDFICKPITPATVKARIKTHLSLLKTRKALEKQNQFLEQKVRERTHEIELTQEAAIYSLSLLAEARDQETGEHIQRTQQFVKLLAQKLQTHPKYQSFLDDKTIEILFKSAPLHDIGKIAVPDHILKKPGKLTAEETLEMQKHTIYGGDAISKAEKLSGSSSFLTFAREIAYAHQEKWDGSGYPKGLKGNQIPISARLMALADVYDALVNKRVYKPAFSHKDAVDYINQQKGLHFDPDMVNAFIEIESEFKAITQHFNAVLPD
ncbi:MAG: response regulator [Methylococcaceae bacterium]|nr:response regulator [Methylococcaceae bacterium]